MLYLRGNKHNYDDWANEGATGWSYEDVLPYFKKAEDNVNFEYVKNGYHGTDGPETVSKPRYDPPLKLAVLETAVRRGYRVGDINGPNSTGFYNFQALIRNGQRCSAAKAYLAPVDYRTNLDIVAEAFVKKIVIENRQAKGVEFEFEGVPMIVRANKEVIMSAGTINTAQLLMLSGIGPKEELKKHKTNDHDPEFLAGVVESLILSRFQAFPWRGVLTFGGGGTTEVSFLSLAYGSKLRGPSPIDHNSGLVELVVKL
ncbi:glucose dehydrogenase [Trichonephila clavipes]|nr:glucose dehydrogenase [Trichonephila clavipes]